MDKIFIRNYTIFVVFLFLCVSWLGFFLIEGEKQLDQTEEWVQRSHKTIVEAQEFSALVRSMLSSQRGYLLSGDQDFLREYQTRKQEGSDLISNLAGLLESNNAQLSRLNEIRNYFNDFSIKLEERAQFVGDIEDPENPLKDVTVVNSLRDDIIRLNEALLEEEYSVLEQRILTLDNKKKEYFTTLLIGLCAGTGVLLLFNGFLLHSQRKRTKIEESLKASEDRFALAVDGTQDGIWDWDTKTDEIFYSRQFFAQLGIDSPGKKESLEYALDMVHEDDREQVEKYAREYIDGNLSEYVQEFRMKHASGRWLWIQSRAKGLFDKNNKAYRVVGAHSDITHVKQAQEKLKADKEEAQSANRAKSEFLAHMSHEIRTPVTAISGIAEILQKQSDTLNEKQQQLVKTLNSSTLSLKELINDILDFSKIESGEIELDQEEFELDKIFEQTISMMAIKANEKGVSFVFDYEIDKSDTLIGDGMRVRQVLVNLIGNAIKFTDDGGVTVKAYYEDRDGADYLRVDVTDTGIGIKPEDFDLVFERFKQADSSVSRKYGGTGLGLPISKKLSQLMGGDIFLSSEYGKGSTFSFMIPANIRTKSAKKGTGKRSIKKLNETIKETINDSSRALIVEDYEGNVVVLTYILDELGFEYDVGRTGLEGVGYWEKNHYDIILMDVQMPEMDGFTATNEIRKLEKTSDRERTPIIGMTAHALVGDRDKCIAAGMDSYLPKPVVEKDLKVEILKFLKEKKKAA
ncbi:MAG: response regulator [Alphaproteobacteria bacterium]|nr:response regulator [Alphaproteobacteria bacterium]